MMNPKAERQYDIDWLRCSAMLMVFLFHCARFFDDYPLESLRALLAGNGRTYNLLVYLDRAE